MNSPLATISSALPGHAPLTPALVDRLRKICGREHVYTDADQLRTPVAPSTANVRPW